MREHLATMGDFSFPSPMAHPVNWFQIDGLEGETLADFYGKVFRWKMKKSPDGSMTMASAAKGGIPGGIGPSRNGQGQVSVYVAVPDIEKQLATIESEGGRAAMPKTDLPSGMGSIAGFTDPAGNFVGLWQEAKKSKAKKSGDKASKKADGKKGDAKKADGKKGDDDAKKGDAKKGDAKKGDSKKGDSKKGDSKKGDAKKADAKKADDGGSGSAGKSEKKARKAKGAGAAASDGDQAN